MQYGILQNGNTNENRVKKGWKINEKQMQNGFGPIFIIFNLFILFYTRFHLLL